LLIKEKDVFLYEPYMLLYLESPVEYAGFVTNDIQSRQGIIREVGGDGKTHFLKAEVPLRNFFGYSTVLRSISKGKAHYEMQFLKFKEKAF
jgi:elongation factor G